MSQLNGAPRPGKTPAPAAQETGLDLELQKARTEINQNLINPLAECQNLLQGLRFDSLDALLYEESSLADALSAAVGPKEAARIAKRITTQLLPQLQSAVTRLTNDPAYGAQVSLSSLLEAVRRVQTKEKARRDFSYELMDAIRSTNHTVFNENNNDQAKKVRPKELKRDPDITALAQHLEAYSSTDPHDIAEARSAAETALRSLLLKRQWNLPTEALLGPHVNVKELWNKATGGGTGVRALADVFLRELEVGKKTAFDAIESRLGKRLVLPKDTIATRADVFLQYYQRLEQSQPDTFIADRLVPHMEQRADGSLGRTRDVVSISTPVSKMLLALQTTEEAKAMIEEGISAELPSTFSFETTTKEFETFLGDTLLNAAKVAEGKNRDGSKKIASNKDILARAHALATALSPTLLESAYEEAKQITKEEWAKEQKIIDALPTAGNYDTLEAPPHPDNFTMLQAAFTYILLDKIGFTPALTEITGGTFTKPLTMGVRHADEVTARLQSLELNESIGQKRLIIETFINTLPDAVEDILKEPAAHNIPADEKTAQRIRHAAQAFWLLATELREGRLNVDDVRKKETAKLLENFALAYGTLVRRGIVRPVSMTLPDVERFEGESDAEYAERSGRIHQERKTKLAQERDLFRSTQAQLIAKDMLGFLEKLDSGDDLRQNFIGTLGQILGKRGKELKAALDQRMKEVAANPERFEKAHSSVQYAMKKDRGSYVERVPTWLRNPALEATRKLYLSSLTALRMRQADLDDLMKDIEKIYTLIETEEPHVPSIQSNFAVLQEKISSKKFDQKIKELLSEWISHKKEDPLTEEQYNTLYSLIRTRTTGLTQEYERLRKQAIDMRITLLTAIIAALREGTSPDDTDTVAAIDDLENQVRQGEAQSDPALLDKVLLTVLPTIVNE